MTECLTRADWRTINFALALYECEGSIAEEGAVLKTLTITVEGLAADVEAVREEAVAVVEILVGQMLRVGHSVTVEWEVEDA